MRKMVMAALVVLSLALMASTAMAQVYEPNPVCVYNIR